MVPFSWLALEMCRNLCFISTSRKRRGVQLLWTYLLPLKTSTCQIRFHLLGLFLSCAEIYVSFIPQKIKQWPQWSKSYKKMGPLPSFRNLYRHQNLLHTNFHVDRFGSFRAYMDQTDKQTDKSLNEKGWV